MAVKHIRDQVVHALSANACGPSVQALTRIFSSKAFDYVGTPVEYICDLVAEKVIPTWPKKGAAAIQPLVNFLEGTTRDFILHPEKVMKPKQIRPATCRRSKVRASDEEWCKIVSAAFEHGMTKPASDATIPRDSLNCLIVNGAGAVVKIKQTPEGEVELQRFISIFCPINDFLEKIPGDEATLPYIG